MRSAQIKNLNLDMFSETNTGFDKKLTIIPQTDFFSIESDIFPIQNANNPSTEMEFKKLLCFSFN